MDSDHAGLHQVVEQLRRHRSIPLDQVPVPQATLAQLGLEVSDGAVHWPSSCEPLDAGQISAELRANQRVTVLPTVDSTNDWLRAQGSADLSGQLVTAECQLAGKGRLGRRWSTPIGGGIALSLGLKLDCQPDRLGGLSLVVGLAVLEAVDPQGQLGLLLKWPNDVLVGARKLGGILIEIVRTGDEGTELIAGIGLNYHLTDSVHADIDREVADLRSLGLRSSRNAVIGAIASEVTGFAQAFAASGFEPFQNAFNAVHGFHERDCQILEGAQRTATGRVAGVDANGRLLLRQDGRISTFNAGEVSLREH